MTVGSIQNLSGLLEQVRFSRATQFEENRD